MNRTHSCRFVIPLAAALVLSACGTGPDGLTEQEIVEERSAIVAGTTEPDYQYPWVVHVGGCRGVLIDPSWVLTAAHCVTRNGYFSGGTVTYSRTDPYTGSLYTGSRTVNLTSKTSNVIMHPGYDPKTYANDIALLRLSSPFAIDKYIQTAGLPATPRVGGTVATVASGSHTLMVPAGHTAIFRGPLPAPSTDYGALFDIHASQTNNASLCPGDSGSGLVTYESGRAVVRGIASNVSTSDCTTPYGSNIFSDVYSHRGWILKTMNRTDATLAGNTRLRWRGRSSRGTLAVACADPAGNRFGPTNVIGVEEGANCPAGDTQTVLCSLTAGQAVVIASFSMKTTYPDGSSVTQSLPFGSALASYYGPNPPAGAVREFSCTVNVPYVTPTIFDPVVAR